MANNSTSAGGEIYGILNGNAGAAQGSNGITTNAFLLNLATGVALFAFELTGFSLLVGSKIGRRIYQPKTYLVQERLRVEPVPSNPLKWLQRLFTIEGDELKAKCGLDGYFAIRFIRAMILIFLPLLVLILPILLPVNYVGGKDKHTFVISGHNTNFNVTGLDTLSWVNVAPTKTNRYWAHLVCALLAISWTLYRIYREKLHFVQARQEYLTSPEHRLKASAKTILVTNIPKEYRSEEALKNLFDVFVDNDDISRLHVWLNRDYGPLRKLTARRRKLCHALEKEELRMLRLVNKKYHSTSSPEKKSPAASADSAAGAHGTDQDGDGPAHSDAADAQQLITRAFEEDVHENNPWRSYLDDSTERNLKICSDGHGGVMPVKRTKPGQQDQRAVPKIAWYRAEIARLTVQIEEMLSDLSNTDRFKRQNSAFVQFDRQMAANMACALVTHHKIGCMSPRFLHVAPHEILWPNMGLTSLARFIKTVAAFALFVGMIILWGIPATFLGILSQLDYLRNTTSYLYWLRSWPSWIISFISGPVSAILLALLIQLVVPALCRKLAVLVGAPTRSKRELVTQGFYFTFLFVELVLVTSISSGIFATISSVIANPTTITTKLATDLPKAANYFFNYLIIQALGFSGSVLFQYLRLLYITTIWPWFTQTPREEAWLQTTIPHQMWANVICMWTNFAALGLIYSVIAPLMLVFISIVFCLFWLAYRHNYYYVQRNKIDTHGLLFNNALSQLFAGVYVLEISLIGLFFLVRNTKDNVACTAQAIIMIVALALTAAYHYVLEGLFAPLIELVPVTMEDKAAEAEKKRFQANPNEASIDGADSDDEKEDVEKTNTTVTNGHPQSTALDGQAKSVDRTAANARKTMSRLHKKIDLKLATNPVLAAERAGASHRREIEDQLGSAIGRYPDELSDLTPQERQAVLRAAYQDPVTREPHPIIWIPTDDAGVAEETVKQVQQKYGRFLQYSNAGAYLTRQNKCEIINPPPDVRPDWLIDWAL